MEHTCRSSRWLLIAGSNPRLQALPLLLAEADGRTLVEALDDLRMQIIGRQRLAIGEMVMLLMVLLVLMMLDVQPMVQHPCHSPRQRRQRASQGRLLVEEKTAPRTPGARALPRIRANAARPL